MLHFVTVLARLIRGVLDWKDSSKRINPLCKLFCAITEPSKLRSTERVLESSFSISLQPQVLSWSERVSNLLSAAANHKRRKYLAIMRMQTLLMLNQRERHWVFLEHLYFLCLGSGGYERHETSSVMPLQHETKVLSVLEPWVKRHQERLHK